ncbi:MAG TPA: metallophosphoesterase [Humisphaera sp.]
MRIAVVGDTQRTTRPERWLLRREQNDGDRPRVVAEIAASRPDVVVHLGDLVAHGSRRADWAWFDDLFAPITGASVPVLPAMGNHDWSGGRPGPHLARRFPWMVGQTWYARSIGPLRFVWVDSNRGRLRLAAWREQAAWIAGELAAADADPAVRGVLVVCHHPPITNSTVEGDAGHVVSPFVEPFERCRKGLAFLSGHTHAYERFERAGRPFVVAGGGGGPRVRLRAGRDEAHQDRVTLPSPRPFHFLLIEPGSAGVDFTVRGSDKGAAGWRTIDTFRLPFVQPPP